MFIKHGDGQIISVLDEEELTKEQKKTAKTLSKSVPSTEKIEHLETQKKSENS